MAYSAPILTSRVDTEDRSMPARQSVSFKAVSPSQAWRRGLHSHPPRCKPGFAGRASLPAFLFTPAPVGINRDTKLLTTTQAVLAPPA